MDNEQGRCLIEFTNEYEYDAYLAVTMVTSIQKLIPDGYGKSILALLLNKKPGKMEELQINRRNQEFISSDYFHT